MDGFMQTIGKMFEALFSHIGIKLQVLAKVLLGVGFFSGIFFLLIAAFSAGDSYYSNDIMSASQGFLFMCVCCELVGVLVFCWMLYAFGQLVEDVHQQNARPVRHTDEYDDLPML